MGHQAGKETMKQRNPNIILPTTLGALFTHSLRITNPDDCKRWGLIVQSFISTADSQQSSILPSLLKLKESVYREWIHPTWKS